MSCLHIFDIWHHLASFGIIWHHLTFGILFDLPPESALVSTIALLRESFVAVFGQPPAPALTGQEPQPVDDDDADYTIPEHDEELTEKDIVKILVLIGLFLLSSRSVLWPCVSKAPTQIMLDR